MSSEGDGAEGLADEVLRVVGNPPLFSGSQNGGFANHAMIEKLDTLDLHI